MKFNRKSVKIIAYSSGYMHSRIFSAILVRLVMDHNERLIRFIIYIYIYIMSSVCLLPDQKLKIKGYKLTNLV